MEAILIIIGVIILLVTFFDFFHTTLSGNGFWFISDRVNAFLSAIILKNKSKSIFDYSGLIHLLGTTFTWLFFLIFGTFIIFLAGEEMVVNANTKIPATIIERFYYTCYLLSTLGIGDFVPGNNHSRIISSILSFSGFILLTISLTYLISVLNSVLYKKELAFYIASFGGNIEEVYEFATLNPDLSVLTDRSNHLKQSIIKNSSNYLAFPIVQYFLTRNRKESLILQLTILYEVLMVLKNGVEPHSLQDEKIKILTTSIVFYLKMDIRNGKHQEVDTNIEKPRNFWKKYNLSYHNDFDDDKSITAALQLAGWTWEDVYKLNNK